MVHFHLLLEKQYSFDTLWDEIGDLIYFLGRNGMDFTFQTSTDKPDILTLAGMSPLVASEAQQIVARMLSDRERFKGIDLHVRLPRPPVPIEIEPAGSSFRLSSYSFETWIAQNKARELLIKAIRELDLLPILIRNRVSFCYYSLVASDESCFRVQKTSNPEALDRLAKLQEALSEILRNRPFLPLVITKFGTGAQNDQPKTKEESLPPRPPRPAAAIKQPPPPPPAENAATTVSNSSSVQCIPSARRTSSSSPFSGCRCS